MGAKNVKQVTETLAMFDDFPQNKWVAGLAVKWVTESLTAYKSLGITFEVNDAPEPIDGWQPAVSVEVSGPKQYLGADELRTRGSQIRCFCIGAAYALGNSEVDKKITV